MDSSTIIFILTVGVAFLFLRWIITPIPHEIPHEIQQMRQNSRRDVAPAPARRPSGNRQVTESMIEVVQAIAPQLTVGQIRHDLERSGSVEATVERYMELGTLPFPPGELPVDAAPATTGRESGSREHGPADGASDGAALGPVNLLEKYNIRTTNGGENGGEDGGENDGASSSSTGTWGASKEERMSNLDRKRQEMILRARQRLASQLQAKPI